jgi:RNA polymerase sigma-70 factor (ECF subfamily)
MSPDAPVPDDVASFRAGESDSFQALFTRCSPYLAAVARPFARDADDLRELVQRAWTRIYERRLAFDGRGSLLGWMMAVCRRECLGRARREKVRWAAEMAYSAGLEAGEGAEEAEPLSAAESRSIHAAVAALPPRQRDAVLLRILDGRSTRETARIMGCAEGTVKALLHQGVERLRESMGGAK